MKRFASHYIFLPSAGFLKQYVVEMNGEYAVSVFPLTEEIESVEWLPGVIILTPFPDIEKCCPEKEFIMNIHRQENRQMTFDTDISKLNLVAYLLYPFNFTTMQPVAGTQRKQLP